MRISINCFFFFFSFKSFQKEVLEERGSGNILFFQEKGEKMNKNDLVQSIASAAQISKVAAERGLNGMISTMAEAMEDGERVTLVGFGSFSIVKRAPRIGRNPKTGESIPIPPRKTVKFRPGKELTQKVQ